MGLASLRSVLLSMIIGVHVLHNVYFVLINSNAFVECQLSSCILELWTDIMCKRYPRLKDRNSLVYNLTLFFALVPDN